MTHRLPFPAAAVRTLRPIQLARALFASALVAPAAATFFGITVRTASAASTIVVANCDDNGKGSLRAAVHGLAASGDTIDLGQLSCSTITLTSGAIATNLDDLRIIGPAWRIEISGSQQSPVIMHAGTGTLTLVDLAIAHGYQYASSGTARGGCIQSAGSVLLNDVTVSDCVATSPDAASGGGIFAAGNLMLVDSVVTGARAITGSGGANGGGVHAGGHLTAKYSAIAYNAAEAAEVAGSTSCGGAEAPNATLIASSIVANSADYFGGLCADDANATQALFVSNSTIADNRSLGGAPSTGGTGINAKGSLKLYNSTVAHNTQVAAGAGVGVHVRTTATIVSSIIAENCAADGAQPADLAGDPGASIVGDHNLIRASTLALPADTLNADPRLEPIRVFANGRPTAYVRAPAPDSPAIDAGSNPLDLDHDQRGAPNARVVGTAADIGAVERDPDHIFINGFET